MWQMRVKSKRVTSLINASARAASTWWQARRRRRKTHATLVSPAADLKQRAVEFVAVNHRRDVTQMLWVALHDLAQKSEPEKTACVCLGEVDEREDDGETFLDSVSEAHATHAHRCGTWEKKTGLVLFGSTVSGELLEEEVALLCEDLRKRNDFAANECESESEGAPPVPARLPS